MSAGPLKCVLVESSLLNSSDDGLRQWTRSAHGSVTSGHTAAAAKTQCVVAHPSAHSTPRQQICPLTPQSACATGRAALEPLFVNEAFSASAEGSGAGVRLSPPYAEANADTTLSTSIGYVRTWPRQRGPVASSTAGAAASASTVTATPSMATYVPHGGNSESITADALNAQRRLLRSHSTRKRSRPALLASSPLVTYDGAANDLHGYLYTPTGSTVCSTLVCDGNALFSVYLC